MTPFIRHVLSEAKKMGLTDATIVNQKKHACLIAQNPNGKTIRLGIGRSKHASTNFRQTRTALADLRRLVRS